MSKRTLAVLASLLILTGGAGFLAEEDQEKDKKEGAATREVYVNRVKLAPEVVLEAEAQYQTTRVVPRS